MVNYPVADLAALPIAFSLGIAAFSGKVRTALCVSFSATQNAFGLHTRSAGVTLTPAVPLSHGVRTRQVRLSCPNDLGSPLSLSLDEPPVVDCRINTVIGADEYCVDPPKLAEACLAAFSDA